MAKKNADFCFNVIPDETCNLKKINDNLYFYEDPNISTEDIIIIRMEINEYCKHFDEFKSNFYKNRKNRISRIFEDELYDNYHRFEKTPKFDIVKKEILLEFDDIRTYSAHKGMFMQRVNETFFKLMSSLYNYTYENTARVPIEIFRLSKRYNLLYFAGANAVNYKIMKPADFLYTIRKATNFRKFFKVFEDRYDELLPILKVNKKSRETILGWVGSFLKLYSEIIDKPKYSWLAEGIDKVWLYNISYIKTMNMFYCDKMRHIRGMLDRPYPEQCIQGLEEAIYYGYSNCVAQEFIEINSDTNKKLCKYDTPNGCKHRKLIRTKLSHIRFNKAKKFSFNILESLEKKTHYIEYNSSPSLKSPFYLGQINPNTYLIKDFQGYASVYEKIKTDIDELKRLLSYKVFIKRELKNPISPSSKQFFADLLTTNNLQLIEPPKFREKVKYHALRCAIQNL